MDFILLAVLIVGFYVGWNIGSNDAANAMGVPVGGRIISHRQAIALIVLFVLLGAVLEGWKVMETVGKGIIISPVGNPLVEIPVIAVVAILAAGVWVTIATTFRLPVSTSQSIVGSVIGGGLLLSILNLPSAPSTSVNLGILGEIGLAWAITPFGSAFFAYFFYHLAGAGLSKVKSITNLNKILGLLVVGTGAFTAYSLGANTVGNATAMVYVVAESIGKQITWTPRLVGLFGGIALSVGAITYSQRVMEAVGTGITRLDPTTAFAAQFGAAFTVWIFTQFGIPVSTSQAIVGGVAGAGLVKGTKAVSRSKLGEIAIAWVLTPTVAAGLTFVLGWIILTGAG